MLTSNKPLKLLLKTLLIVPLVAFVTIVAIAFGHGVMSWFEGTARMHTMGWGTEQANLSRETRVPWTNDATMMADLEWMVREPNNVAVEMMTRLFGFSRGAYDGPYPSKAQAVEALVYSRFIPDSQLRAGRVELAGGVTVRLDRDVGHGLLTSNSNPYKSRPIRSPDAGPVQATLIGRRCLILRIPFSPPYQDTPQDARIVLVDVRTGRPFAYYAQGNYWHSTPPVEWYRE